MAIRLRTFNLAGVRTQIPIALVAFSLIFLSACATTIPGETSARSPDYRLYANSYAEVWRVVTSVTQNEGMSLDIMDRDSGILNGIKNLQPSTIDMLTNYSVRIRASITIRRTEGNSVEVTISSQEERKYQERGWRPARDASSYSAALFDAFDKQLTPRSTGTRTSPAAPISRDASGSGFSRQEIRETQRLLNSLGHEAGAPDGLLGPKTAAGIASFQRTVGISATGILDTQTLDSLRQAAPTEGEAENFPIAEETISGNEAKELGQPRTVTSAPNVATIAPVRVAYALVETELKASADPFSSTLTKIGKGRELKVLKDNGDWLHIQYDGREGYVFSEFVSR